MSRRKIEKQAYEYFKSGYYCCESVYKTITEASVENVDRSLTRLASGFVGGMGSSHEETCGALTGGIMALGYFYGRNEPDTDIARLKALVVEYKKRFKDEFGSTNCGVLLDTFGEQGDDYARCRDLTARAAGILAELLAEHDNNNN